MSHPLISVAYGDGIGPEIMEATLEILRQSEAQIQIQVVEIGKKIYDRCFTSGITEETLNNLANSKALLKGPIITPQAAGYQSLNVTLRKMFRLYANVRPIRSYAPSIKTFYPNLDIVIFRENEEDLYVGVEYHQTPNVYKSIKLVTELNSAKIIRYAFEYAIRHNRKKVSCFTKHNIMKFTDGIFYKMFEQIAEDYPTIEHNHYIADVGMAKLATNPEDFDVIVTLNLYGDIVSDIAAQLSGSIGLAGSANIGDNYMMFEAVHGAAPNIADQDKANPSGLISAAVMMLKHLGQLNTAYLIRNAFLKTIQDGIHTADIYNNQSSKLVGTKDFARAIIERLGQAPEKKLTFADKEEYKSPINVIVASKTLQVSEHQPKRLVGADIFLSSKYDIKQFIDTLLQITKTFHTNQYSQENQESGLKKELLGGFADFRVNLEFVSFCGLKIWSESQGFLETMKGNISTEFLRARFKLKFTKGKNNYSENNPYQQEYSQLLLFINNLNSSIEILGTENLYEYEELKGYSEPHGQD